jgi:hypothetical protein
LYDAESKFGDKEFVMRMTWALAGAISAAALFALAGVRRPSSSLGGREPALAHDDPATQPASEPTSTGLAGEVLETLAVPKYTYLRLQTASGEVWAAIPSASVALHSHVQIADATRMDDFKSSTLSRTFPVIYFGTLASAPNAQPEPAAAIANLPAVSDDQPLPPGHPAIGSAENADSLPPGHPSLNEAAPFDAPPHGSAMADSAAALPALPPPPSQPATGKNAHRVAELVAARASLAGQRVRVRGEVTKVTDVQDHAFFHIRDSSLGPDGQPADLVLISSTRPKRGEIATFEGLLRVDVDVGIGFKYPALLENAAISAE